jgi:hypothetical protein
VALYRKGRRLYGFLRRKGGGEPGAETIWTGLQGMMDLAAGIRAFKAGEICVLTLTYAAARDPY